MFSLPFSLIAGLTAKIIVAVRRANRCRQAMSRQQVTLPFYKTSTSPSPIQARESRTTEMMLVLVGNFLGANILPFALSIIEINMNRIHTSYRYRTLYHILPSETR